MLQDRRVWLAGALATAVLLAAAGWLLLIGPRSAAADALRAQAADRQAQAATLAAHNAKLRATNRHIAQLRAELATAVHAVPPDTDLPGFTEQVNAAAVRGAVTLTSMSVGGVAPVSASGAPAASTSGSTSDGGASAQYAITVTLLTQGPQQHQIDFLRALRSGTRRVLVTSTQLNVPTDARAGTVDARTTMATQVTVFSAPMTTAQRAQLRTMLGTDS